MRPFRNQVFLMVMAIMIWFFLVVSSRRYQLLIWKKVLFFLLFEVLKNGRGLVWEDVKQRLFLEWRRGLVLYNLQSTFLQFVSFLEFLILICIGFTLVSNVLDDCNTCDLWFVSIFPCDSAFLCATGRGHRTYVQRFKPRGAWRCVLHGLNFLKGCCE